MVCRPFCTEKAGTLETPKPVSKAALEVLATVAPAGDSWVGCGFAKSIEITAEFTKDPVKTKHGVSDRK